MLDYVQLDDDLSIFELNVPESWISKIVAEINVCKKYNINIMDVFGDDKMSAP